MPDWIRRTALGDILRTDFSELAKDALYRNLDRLHPQRETIERELAEREKTLFTLDDIVYLYDLTSTYFEGVARKTPKRNWVTRATSGPIASRLWWDWCSIGTAFPKAHEIFEGNRQDRRTVDEMLGVWRNERVSIPARRSSWTGAWRLTRTWSRSLPRPPLPRSGPAVGEKRVVG